mgnify:CR=1 FL=1
MPKSSTLKTKIKVIFLPFLLVGIGTILAYGLIRWVFDVQLGLLHIHEKYLNFWVPTALPWIGILIWLRPRLKIVKFSRRRTIDGYINFQFLLAIAITIPTIISQEYLVRAAYPLVALGEIEELDKHPKEKFFTIEEYMVDKNAKLTHISSRTSGKANQTLNFHIHYAVPFRNVKHTYFAVHYHEWMNNSANDYEKKSTYSAFRRNAIRSFDLVDFYDVKYFEKAQPSNELEGWMKAIESGQDYSLNNKVVVLIPKNDEFADRLGHRLPWIFGSYGIGALIVFIILYFAKIDERLI